MLDIHSSRWEDRSSADTPRLSHNDCNLCCVDVIIDEAKSSTCDGDQITVAVAVVMLEEVLTLFLLQSVAGVVPAVILWLGVRSNMITLEVIDLLRLSWIMPRVVPLVMEFCCCRCRWRIFDIAVCIQWTVIVIVIGWRLTTSCCGCWYC